jgi:hypothetical protein
MPPPAGIADHELANGEAPDYYRKMDRRLIVLETRFDTIVPTLATKADLIGLRAELKADISELCAEMHKWMTTTLISLFVGFGGMLLTMVTLLRPA